MLLAASDPDVTTPSDQPRSSAGVFRGDKSGSKKFESPLGCCLGELSRIVRVLTYWPSSSEAMKLTYSLVV